MTSNRQSKLLTGAECGAVGALLDWTPLQPQRAPLPTSPAITAGSISAIYSWLTFCYWAPIQPLSLCLSLSGSVTEWPLDRHIPSSPGSEVIIMPTLHFRIPIVNPLGASFQVANEYVCQSHSFGEWFTFHHAMFHALLGLRDLYDSSCSHGEELVHRSMVHKGQKKDLSWSLTRNCQTLCCYPFCHWLEGQYKMSSKVFSMESFQTKDFKLYLMAAK